MKRLVLILLGTALLYGCGRRDRPIRETEVKISEVVSEIRDLDRILKDGSIRILRTDEPELTGLPRSFSMKVQEVLLLRNFAEDHDLDIEWVTVPSFGALLPALAAGKGDLVANNLTITQQRAKTVAFTYPMFQTLEKLVTGSAAIKSIEDLHGKNIVLVPGTSYWQSAERLKVAYPFLKIVPAPHGVTTEELLYHVAQGHYDCTLADNNLIENAMYYQPNLQTVHTLPEERAIALAVHTTSEKLLAELNSFLKEEMPEYRIKNFIGDLPEIRKRGFLRVLTRNNATCYFVHRGELMGFEYELTKRYAKQQGLDIVIIVPPRWQDTVQWLKDGKGDVIAACATITDQRKNSADIQFCHPYGELREMVVTRTSDNSIKSLQDLAGRTFYVRRGSSYWESLNHLKDTSGIPFNVRATSGKMETFQILEKVESGEYDLTVADDLLLDLEAGSRQKRKAVLPLSEPRNYGWIVRNANPELKESIDAFFKKEHRGAVYNVLYKKYFRNQASIKKFEEIHLSGNDPVISPYDKLVKQYADEYGFHWCLINAQMYQESRFDPKAKSWAGAMGLMQLMPTTAKEVGIRGSLYKPGNSIRGGVKYMHKQYSRFPEEVEERNRLCFSLAAYNGGYGHLIDARNLAEQLGLDRNQWLENVDQAYELLSRPEYAAKARYGYCRSEEIIPYVRQIMARYYAYKTNIELIEKRSNATAK